MVLTIEDTIKRQLKEYDDHHFFLVDNMSKLMTGKVQECESSDFHVFGFRWRFLIRRVSASASGIEALTFYLGVTDEKCVGPNWEVRCSYTISVVCQTGYKDYCRSFAGCYNINNYFQGIDNFISFPELEKKGFLVNDKAIFCATIWKAKPNFPITSIPRPMSTAQRIKLMDIPRSNCRFTWEIKKFSSVNISEQHYSDEFTVGPRRWKLVMCPNGNGEGKGNSLSLYLKVSENVTNGPEGRTLAVFKLRALDQLHRNHFETSHQYWFHYDPVSMYSTFGCPKWLPLKELYNASRGLLVNDQIYIGVEFLIVSISEYL